MLHELCHNMQHAQCRHEGASAEGIHQGWFDAKAENLWVYKYVFSELAVVNRIVVRGDRIVVPETLRQRMVEIGHKGHQGKVRMKQLLRAHLWFTGNGLSV